MPNSRSFLSLSALIAGVILVSAKLLLLEGLSKFETLDQRSVASANQLHVVRDVSEGSPYTGAISAVPSDNGSTLEPVRAGSEIDRPAQYGGGHELPGAASTAPSKAVAGADSAERVDAIAELVARFEDGEPATETVQVAPAQFGQTMRASGVSALETQAPVRTVMADRTPEQNTVAVTETGIGFTEDEPAGDLVSPVVPQSAGSRGALRAQDLRAHDSRAHELPTQEPAQKVVANTDPERVVQAETQRLEGDGEAPKRTTKKAKTSAVEETSPKVQRRQAPIAAVKKKSPKVERKETKPAPAVIPKKKPNVPILTQKPKKTAPAPSRQKAMTLGSPKQIPQKNRVSAKNYHKLVWSRVARHKPRAGRRGSATVTFGIGMSGMLRGVRVSRSSGDTRLDQLAIAAVRSAAPFPRPPAGVGRRPFSVTIYFR